MSGHKVIAFLKGVYLAKACACQEKILQHISSHVAMNHSCMVWMFVETLHSTKFHKDVQ